LVYELDVDDLINVNLYNTSRQKSTEQVI